MHAPDFWDRKSNGFWPNVLRPLGCVVAGMAAMKRRSAMPWASPLPVICVGNLVAGGAGKTPVAIDLAERMERRGVKAHVLTRGYGGHEFGPLRVDVENHIASEVGDEPLLLAKSAPTWVARDRRQGIEAAMAEGAQAIILDDGFQNFTVTKDLSLLVVDGGYGFGNARVMPAGPLREPVETGLARADAVILM
ncbi:MAG: tetraacyldisaccharide 4'-kinase, partial [Alphaproteobacteria bacterium]|nr:tetraacyldisaccharide 4'-kinase [Alphaproteobacteria bacterium]